MIEKNIFSIFQKLSENESILLDIASLYQFLRQFFQIQFLQFPFLQIVNKKNIQNLVQKKQHLNQVKQMQKMIKTKINYKKSPSQKQLFNKYQFKQSQTLSTNESKIHHSCEKSCLLTSYANNFNFVIDKNLRKYGNSNDLHYLTDFESQFARTRTRQKILLKDFCYFKNQQCLQQNYNGQTAQKQLQQLTEYYKYYINNPIIFIKQHFKTLYNFYQKKKYLQYKSLKAVLDLDDDRNSSMQDSMNQNITIDAKKSTKQSTKTFYIMNLIHTDLIDQSNQSESKAFLELNKNLEIICRNNNSMEGNHSNQHQRTPVRYDSNNFIDKNITNFKKKKIMPATIYSNKNTISKKSKKQSFNNSNSSFKKIKFLKPSKQLNPFKFQIDQIAYQSTKTKPDQQIRKKRHQSHLSMGDMQIKYQNYDLNTILNPKNYKKKRLNSCETVIHRHSSKERQFFDKKKKKVNKEVSKSRFQKNQQIQLSQFQQYLKKMSTNIKKSIKRQKLHEQASNPFGSSSKVKKGDSQQKVDSEIRIKKMKKKVPTNNSTSKNSIQKSPYHNNRNSKQVLIQQNILNLKNKIRLAKQSIKNTNSNSVSNLQSYKRQRSSNVGLVSK